LVDAAPRTADSPTDIQVFKTIRDEVNNSIYLLSKYNVQLGIVYKYPRQVDYGIMKTGRSFYMAHTFLKRVYDKK